MADMNDLAQKLAFYQNGGQDPGQSGLEKFDKGLGIVDSTIKDVLAIKKAKYEGAKATAETGKLQRDIQTQTTPLGDLTPEEFSKMGQGYHYLNNPDKKQGVNRILNKYTGAKIAEYPNSLGTGDIVTLVGEDTLPSYKKSELLAMSPETRASLGKYKVIDDTSPNKTSDDNQTIDSILSGIGRLSEIRKTMGYPARGATVVPGGTTVGRLFSAPLSNWETEKNLLAQRLGKLVEKNRMSDDDRKFYLRQFSSPLAADAAFDANVNTLKTSLADMKKAGVVGSASTAEDNDPLGIR